MQCSLFPSALTYVAACTFTKLDFNMDGLRPPLEVYDVQYLISHTEIVLFNSLSAIV